MKAILHTPTNALSNSLDFYEKLNYDVVSSENPTIVTDGSVLIEINPDRFARPGVKLYKNSWSDEIEILKNITPVYNIESGFLLNDGNGCWIYLIDGDLNLDPEMTDGGKTYSGNFSGISMESADMKRSMEIWGALGYAKSMGAPEQGYVGLDREGSFSVSLMKPLTCPHLFFNPSMNFFNGKENEALIEKIRNAGVPIAEEITHFNDRGEVDNVILRDPGGYGFFVFND